jgi:sialate O-acetylesterase
MDGRIAITGGVGRHETSQNLVGESGFVPVSRIWKCTFPRRFFRRIPEFVKSGRIRHIRIEPQSRLPEPNKPEHKWRVCDDETYKQFTAVGFFFAYTVSKEVDVPIGLINVSMGNTDIVSWLAPEGIRLVKAEAPEGVFDFSGGSGLFHGRVAPIAGSGIKGMLWYQGERNGGQGESYFWKMKALIMGWREAWGRDDIPFYYVQLPSFTGGGTGWAPTREAQRKALTIPHTGMAVVTDAGDNKAEWPGNLHPRNKYTVGQRLALWALAKDYGKKDLVYSGPLFKSAEFNGGKAIVSFDHLGSGLMAAKKEDTTRIDPPKPVAEVVGFELYGAIDGAGAPAWHPARAAIEGDTVVVSSPGVKQPTAVRYLYTMDTDHGTLYNKEGLPASPFTTGQ